MGKKCQWGPDGGCKSTDTDKAFIKEGNSKYPVYACEKHMKMLKGFAKDKTWKVVEVAK